MIRPWGAVLGIGIIRLALCCLPALADASERSQDAVKASFERPIHSSLSRLPSTGRFLSQDEGGYLSQYWSVSVCEGTIR